MKYNTECSVYKTCKVGEQGERNLVAGYTSTWKNLKSSGFKDPNSDHVTNLSSDHVTNSIQKPFGSKNTDCVFCAEEGYRLAE